MTLIIIAILIYGLFWFLTTNFLNRQNYSSATPKQANRYNLVAGFWWWLLWPLALIIAIIKLIVFIIKGGEKNG